MLPLEREFRAEVAGHLQPHSAALVEVLRRLIAEPIPPQVAWIDFVVLCDGHTWRFPVHAYFVDEDRTEVFVEVDGKPTRPCFVGPGLLALDGIYPDEVLERYEALDPDLQVDTMTASGEVVLEWFNRCWLEAGGTSFDRNATIELHDGPASLDLVRQLWSRYA